jgi:hypothetical protein
MIAPEVPPTGPPPSAEPRSRSASEESLGSALRLARSLGFLVAALAGLLFVLLLVLWVLGVVFRVYEVGPVGVAYCFLSAGVNYLIGKEAGRFETLAARREYAGLRERLPLWAVLGLVFFVVEGLLLLFAYVKADELSSGGRSEGSPGPVPLGGTPPSPPPGAT